MTHAEFLRAYQEGIIQVTVDRTQAARLVSGRLMLPFLLLPLLGLGVGLALSGYLFTGIAVFLGALGLRLLIRASSQGFVLSRALHDPEFYEEMVAGRVLLVKPAQ